MLWLDFLINRDASVAVCNACGLNSFILMSLYFADNREGEEQYP